MGSRRAGTGVVAESVGVELEERLWHCASVVCPVMSVTFGVWLEASKPLMKVIFFCHGELLTWAGGVI